MGGLTSSSSASDSQVIRVHYRTRLHMSRVLGGRCSLDEVQLMSTMRAIPTADRRAQFAGSAMNWLAWSRRQTTHLERVGFCDSLCDHAFCTSARDGGGGHCSRPSMSMPICPPGKVLELTCRLFVTVVSRN